MPKIRIKRRAWTAEELAIVRAHYADVKTERIAALLPGRTLTMVYQAANKLGLRKSAAFLASPEACHMKRNPQMGVPYRFPPGHVPANKGLRRPGYVAGRMAETQFRKGSKAPNWLPIGSTRFGKDGYLQRKVTDTGYSPRDWVEVHRLVWIEAHGPIPPKHRVVFRDGDRTHIALDNLELISMRELMRRNTVHNLPKELVEVIQLRGVLKRIVRSLSEKQNDRFTEPSLRNDRSA